MLIVCNGAVKSGSTWLFNILAHLLPVERPPDSYLTPGSLRPGANPCIRPGRLRAFLEAEDVESVHYLSKNHLDKPGHRDLLLSHPSVRVFDIERDIRDVVVSAYYDERNRNGYRESFERYYWDEGRYLADRVIHYHNLWRDAGPGAHVASYEGLHEDFAAEVRPIAGVLGVEVDERAMQALHERTTLRQLRERYGDDPLYAGDRFFRKGITGDWRNHLEASMVRDIEAIERRGISPLDPRSLARRGRRTLRRLVCG